MNNYVLIASIGGIADSIIDLGRFIDDCIFSKHIVLINQLN